ncbi:hypothetical protein ACFLSZ_04425 [Candidatus Bipolaricaulota bacterium]
MFRLLLGIVGLIGILVALPLLFAGGSLFWVDTALTDANGFVNSTVMEIEVDGFALVAGPAEIEDLPKIPDSPIELGEIATLRIQAENLDSGRGLFIGVASTEALDEYLGGVPYAIVDAVDEDETFLSYRMNASGDPLALPEGQGFWISSTMGTGLQELEWELEEGDVSFVIMNEDGSDGLAIEAVAGVRVPLIGPVGVGLLIGGAVTLAIGTIVLALAL